MSSKTTLNSSESIINKHPSILEYQNRSLIAKVNSYSNFESIKDEEIRKLKLLNEELVSILGAQMSSFSIIINAFSNKTNGKDNSTLNFDCSCDILIESSRVLEVIKNETESIVSYFNKHMDDDFSNKLSVSNKDDAFLLLKNENERLKCHIPEVCF